MTPYNIQFSDYIFREENEETVIRQAKQTLDLTLNKKTKIVVDAETLPEEVDIIVEENSNQQNDKSVKLDRVDKNVYAIGILIAIAFLVLSIVLHFVWK